MTKIKALQLPVLYLLVLGLALYALYTNKIIYVKTNSQSITIGYGKPVSILDYRELDGQILQSKEAIKDADLLIEDARRRGILE